MSVSESVYDACFYIVRLCTYGPVVIVEFITKCDWHRAIVYIEFNSSNESRGIRARAKPKKAISLYRKLHFMSFCLFLPKLNLTFLICMPYKYYKSMNVSLLLTLETVDTNTTLKVDSVPHLWVTKVTLKSIPSPLTHGQKATLVPPSVGGCEEAM